VRLKDGRTLRYPLDRATDAVFMSLAAIDKFVIPYYTRVLSVEDAAALRQEIVQKIPPP
jgi:hypothetical protein